MSTLYDPSSDYRNWWELGSTVCFDAPWGERLTGEIVRVHFGDPCAFHVEANGRRYEVHLHDDNMEMVWDG